MADASWSDLRLSAPIALEEGRQLRLFKGLIFGVCAMAAFAMIWAAVAPIREVASAPGKVTPAGHVRTIQHLEGGIVAAILVQEGDIVDAGTPLIKLQPAAASSDLGQLEARRSGLMIQRRRIDATMRSAPLELGALAQIQPELAQNQRALHKSELIAVGRERATHKVRIAQREAAMRGVIAEMDSTRIQIEFRKEQKDMQEQLFAKGYASRRTLLESSELLQAAITVMVQHEGRLEAAERALDEARSLLAEFESTTQQRYSEQAAEVERELAEVDQQLAKFSDRVDRLLVRAPVHGIVHDLKVRSAGEVVAEGGIIASIVPVDGGSLFSEVQLSPRDVGHVRVGANVRLNLTGFDPSQFGIVEGSVTQISPTTYFTQDGIAYYKVSISLHRQALEYLGRQYPILPGMEVQAEIVTGEKSLMRYLLKPVFRALDTAFSER